MVLESLSSTVFLFVVCHRHNLGGGPCLLVAFHDTAVLSACCRLDQIDSSRCHDWYLKIPASPLDRSLMRVQGLFLFLSL